MNVIEWEELLRLGRLGKLSIEERDRMDMDSGDWDECAVGSIFPDLSICTRPSDDPIKKLGYDFCTAVEAEDYEKASDIFSELQSLAVHMEDEAVTQQEIQTERELGLL